MPNLKIKFDVKDQIAYLQEKTIYTIQEVEEYIKYTNAYLKLYEPIDYGCPYAIYIFDDKRRLNPVVDENELTTFLINTTSLQESAIVALNTHSREFFSNCNTYV